MLIDQSVEGLLDKRVVYFPSHIFLLKLMYDYVFLGIVVKL
ncbi:uncharacterized protein METZ01_LOCUS416599 [marine metagenome]|uniref:Uncharacterized protein n=1 Tax=marine metagenome TaxID=408172 RepID=A0A382WZH3_9ZZZZ